MKTHHKLILYLGIFASILSWGEFASALPDDTLLKLERTQCYGTCSAYEVLVDGKGNLTFIGKAFVCTLGKAIGSTNPQTVSELVDGLRNIDFFLIPEALGRDPVQVHQDCPGGAASDGPYVTVSLRYGDHNKTVRDYHGCHGNLILEKLRTMENKIDDLLQTSRWIEGCGARETKRPITDPRNGKKTGSCIEKNGKLECQSR